MIRINLANSILNKSDSGSKSSSSLSEGKVLRDSVIKIVMIIAPVVGIIFYERTDLETKNQQLQKVTEERDRLSEDLKSKESVDEIVKQVEEQKKEMDDKLKVMEKIFGLRSKKIQTLSLLQKNILQSIWLDKIAFSEVAAETPEGPMKTMVTVTGSGTSIDDIQIYTTTLNQEKGIFEKVKAPNITAEDAAKPDVKRFKFDIVVQD